MQCSWVYLILGFLLLSYTRMDLCFGRLNSEHRPWDMLFSWKEPLCQHQQLHAMQFSESKLWCFVPILYQHGPLFLEGWIVNTGHETCLSAERSQYVSINSSIQCSSVYPSLGVLLLSYTTMVPCSGQRWVVNTVHEICLPAEKSHYVSLHQQINTVQFSVSKPWCFVPFLHHHGPLFGSRLNSENWPWDMSSSWKEPLCM
jgi:hypothetical protein